VSVGDPPDEMWTLKNNAIMTD